MKDLVQIQAALAAKFAPGDLEYRIGRSGIKNGVPWGMCLVYITNRAIQERLDSVMGIGNWFNENREWMGNAVMCKLSLKIDGVWIAKEDAAPNTQFESVKGGVSNAMKRAGVMWGIGRYLYQFDEEFATCFNDSNKGRINATFKDKSTGAEMYGSFNPPKFPDWAMPDGTKERFYDLLSAESAWDYFIFVRLLPEEILESLVGGFPTGEKTRMKEQVRKMDSEGAKQFLKVTDALRVHIERDDVDGIAEVVDELSKEEKRVLLKAITEEEVAAIVDAQEKIAAREKDSE